MAMLVIFKQSGRTVSRIDLRHRRKLTIGRSPRCDLILDAPSVSRRHALLFEHARRWILIDTGSSVGLRSSLSPKPTRRVAFRPNVWVSVGPARLRIERVIPASLKHTLREPPPGRTGRGLMEDGEEASSGPTLAVSGQDRHAARRYSLAGHEVVTVGRAPGCDLVLDEDQVAPLHCVLYTEHRGWYVADAGSGLGTRLEGWLCVRRLLRDHLELQLGGSILWLEGNRRLAGGEDAGGADAAHPALEAGAQRDGLDGLEGFEDLLGDEAFWVPEAWQTRP